MEWFRPGTEMPSTYKVHVYGLHLVLSKQAMEKLRNPEYVMLGYDTESNTLGIRPHDSSGFRCSIDKNYKTGRIPGTRSLVEHIRKSMNGTRNLKIECAWDPEQNALIGEVQNSVRERRPSFNAREETE